MDHLVPSNAQEDRGLAQRRCVDAGAARFYWTIKYCCISTHYPGEEMITLIQNRRICYSTTTTAKSDSSTVPETYTLPNARKRSTRKSNRDGWVDCKTLLPDGRRANPAKGTHSQKRISK